MSHSTDQTKQITLVSSRPPQAQTVAIAPWDTATAVLERAGLDSHDLLMRPGNESDFEPTDRPFGSLLDFTTLQVVPACEVGATR
ncbi:MAG TPA: hypothetical protein VKV39_17050 [Candidatus Sulfotelmatobacter sp.]|nr:hypothetical protein [Candidatus Sulfotelmatobacter sp.]